MTQVHVNGVRQGPVPAARPNELTADRLRTILQDSHLNFLIGAGTPSAYFSRLGNIEQALTDLADSKAPSATNRLVRASIQGYFFENVLVPNLRIVEGDPSAESVVISYATFLRTLNRILLMRHSSLLAKQANLFTTNVDMVFEVALEAMGIDYSDGFSGKIRPRFDPGEFNTQRFRMGSRYEHRSEVPVFNLIKLHGSAGWRQEGRSHSQTAIYFDHSLSLVANVTTAVEKAKRHLVPIANPDEVDAEDLISKVVSRSVPDSVKKFAAAYDKLGIINPDKHKFATTVLNEGEIGSRLLEVNPCWRAAVAGSDPLAWMDDDRVLKDRNRMTSLGFRSQILADVAEGRSPDSLIVLRGPRRVGKSVA